MSYLGIFRTCELNQLMIDSTQGEEYEDVPSPLLPPDLAYLPPTGGSPQVVQVGEKDGEN